MLQEPMQDDEMEDCHFLEAEYCPETFDEFSAPQMIRPSGFLTCADHEEVVFATCIKNFYKFIDNEWQYLGPAEICIFLNKLNGHERVVVWSLKATKAILCNFPVTPYIDNYISYSQENPCLFCHTLSSNYTLSIPEIPTTYTREARVFIPEYRSKSSIFAIKFDIGDAGREECELCFKVFAESVGRAKKIALIDRQTTFYAPQPVRNQPNHTMTCLWPNPGDDQELSPQNLASHGFIFCPAMSSQGRVMGSRIICVYCKYSMDEVQPNMRLENVQLAHHHHDCQCVFGK